MDKIMYIAEGIVVSGKKIGRTLGFPTANLLYPADCMLSNGVYAAQVIVNHEPNIYIAAVNIGVHPSFPEGQPTIEAYLLDTHIDLYLKSIKILFYTKIRDEITFLNKDNLISRIEEDILFVRNYFSSAINTISKLS